MKRPGEIEKIKKIKAKGTEMQKEKEATEKRRRDQIRRQTSEERGENK
mgnify:FL=1